MPCVEGNQEALAADVQAVFDREVAADFMGEEHDDHEDRSPQRRHGRLEGRYTTAIYEPTGLPTGWPDAAAVALMARERGVKGERADTAHIVITSRRGTAAGLAGLIWRRCGIEDHLHLPLAVSFGEHGIKTAKGRAGTNLGLNRRVALSLLRQDPERRASTGSGSMQHGTKPRCCKPFAKSR